jgi:ABC-type multidrug transport system ATPase subunit
VRRAAGFELRVPELELERGSITAVAGPNGSGKSTLLLACAGLLDVAGGAVELDGGPYHRGRAPAPVAARRQVALVHQDPYLLRGSVRRNLSWGMRLRSVPRVERQQRGEQALKALGLDESFALENVARLSGGQQTLVALARALALRPAVLLLDEVTRDLDEHHRAAALESVRSLAREGTAVLLATHDSEIIDTVAHRRVRLDGGSIRGQGAAALTSLANELAPGE